MPNFLKLVVKEAESYMKNFCLLIAKSHNNILPQGIKKHSNQKQISNLNIQSKSDPSC